MTFPQVPTYTFYWKIGLKICTKLQISDTEVVVTLADCMY